VDIDWEYPSSTADEKAFYDLMAGLREFFPSPRYLLSADVPPWGGSYDYSLVEPILDYFNIMMYDCAGPWTDDGQLNSAIFLDPRNPQFYECNPGGSVEQAANIFLSYVNLPPSKINMGTPFYGYLYTNVTQLYGPCNPCDGQTVLSAAYGTFLKQRINQNGWKTFYDMYSLVPYMLRTDGQPGYITYDDTFSTYTRVWYSVWQRGLGGTFMWSIDQDYDGHSQDLLVAMYQASMKQPLHVPIQ
jgi:chitinase